MASKSKRQRAKKESAVSLILLALTVGILALMQNPYGLMSDIGNFYTYHFFDGQNRWPFSEKILLGDTRVQHPVEYPALTGLIMWLISFLVTPTNTVYVDYYRITAAFQIFLLALSAFLIF